MILVINICKEDLHLQEFVFPVLSVLSSQSDIFVRHYTELCDEDLQSATKVIICGTSLHDNQFVHDIDAFRWLEDFEKPVLGICGGMQILGLVFGGVLQKKAEIGYYFETFEQTFLGLQGKQEVYHLHNYFIDFSKLPLFTVYTKGCVSQAVKHKKKPLYGVLFHPEVRNKKVIEDFILL